MRKHKHPPHHHGDLQIRSRTEVSGDGHHASFHSVFCPRQRLSVDLADCETCPNAIAVCVGRERDHVRCSAAAKVDRTHTTLRDAAERTPVSSVMTNDVVCVHEDVSLESLTSLLVERSISGLPVVDQDSRAVGIVSKTDLVRYQREQHDHDGTGHAGENALEQACCSARLGMSTVSEIMTPVALTVPEEASIASATAVMAARAIHRLPVVDDFGRVVGVLAATDIVDWVAQGAPRVLARRGRLSSVI